MTTWLHHCLNSFTHLTYQHFFFYSPLKTHSNRKHMASFGPVSQSSRRRKKKSKVSTKFPLERVLWRSGVVPTSKTNNIECRKNDLPAFMSDSSIPFLVLSFKSPEPALRRHFWLWEEKDTRKMYCRFLTRRP